MPLVTPIDPLKPHVTIAIAYPCEEWSNGVYVMGGGYGGESDDEIRAYFEEASGMPPGTTEANGWRIVDLPYDHGDWIPPVQASTTDRPTSPALEAQLLEMESIVDGVLAQDRLPVDMEEGAIAQKGCVSH
jgi:hypothetical protein